MKKISIYTLGCRLNFAESGEMAETFKKHGMEIVQFGEPADLVIINTCTVTDKADASCRNIIRKARKTNPNAKIAVVGCYAQLESGSIAKMDGVDIVLGTGEKHKILDYVEEQGQIVNIDRNNEFWGASTSLSDGHTRAFLKIQDGCNYMCSYCAIPFARGRAKAISVSDGVKKARSVVEQGFKELVLTGINIGEYESSTGERLIDLLDKILQIDGLERLRISSIEVNTVTDILLSMAKENKKFMPHFHIPLQSGDDTILKLMKRKYNVSQYTETILKIKEAIPNIGIGADVITGFPGETEEMFQNSYELMRSLPITHFHVFPYSMRKNTLAAKMEHQLPLSIRKSRAKELIKLGEDKLLNFSNEQIGKIKSVLFETLNSDGDNEGYTEEFLQVKVQVKNNNTLTNKIIKVRIKSILDQSLIGELI